MVRALLALLALGPALLGADVGEGDCAEAVALRVQAHYADVRDLGARFAQTTRSVVFGGAPAGVEETARGEVVFARPARMRWVYESPEPSVVVSDGETLWIFDPVANEVQVLPVGGRFLSGAAIQLLIGQSRILDVFSARARACGGETADLVLVPREEAAYERLELRVEAETGAVLQTAVLDLFGNRTEVAFESMQTNQDPPDELFRFEPPEGARVLVLQPVPEPAEAPAPAPPAPERP